MTDETRPTEQQCWDSQAKINQGLIDDQLAAAKIHDAQSEVNHRISNLLDAMIADDRRCQRSIHWLAAVTFLLAALDLLQYFGK